MNIVADLILYNGDIRTQNPADPKAKAVAISEGRILALGDNRKVKALAGAGTDLVDLQGRLCLPGFIDSHFHYYDWALGRRNLELAGIKSFAEFIRAVAETARKLPPGDWILGQGWNEADWPENRLPTRHDLDPISPDHPVMLWRCDLHLAVVNSKALALAGIDDSTPDPQDGIIVRDESGTATGVLREMAPNLIKPVIPALTPDAILSAMRDGMPALHALGLTGVHDVRIPGGVEWRDAFTAWQRLRAADELNLRCWVGIPSERLEEAVGLGIRSGFGDDRLRIGQVKFFGDGGMGARTAWLLEPYLDGGTGMCTYPIEELEAAIRRADRAGLAVMVHAIGDRTNRELVRIFERIETSRVEAGESAPAPPVLPHRIEHAQMIRPEDIARISRLPVAVSVQPHNMILDINMIDRCVAERGRFTYPYRQLIDARVPVMLSSDCPVCSPDPLVGIHAAVTRRRADGTPEGGWYPEHRITVEEAVRGYTVIPAAAYRMENELGTITPGKRADMIVLDRNIFDIDPMEIIDATVDVTVFDGEVVFQKN